MGILKDLMEAGFTSAEKIGQITALVAALDDNVQNTTESLKTFSEALNGTAGPIATTIDSFVKFTSSIGNLVIAQAQYNGIINDTVRLLPRIGEPMADLMKAQYDAAASFNASTGMAGKFSDVIGDLVIETSGLGVSSQETAQIMTTLLSGFTDLTMESDASILSLAETVVQLNALGMGTSESVGSIQTLRKAFGMSNEEIRDTMLGIEAFAEEAGIDIQQISGRLNAQLPVFAVYGNNAVETFKRLELATKGTGLAMETMLGTVRTFDTFEGATDSVGRLNQMLGGPYLNSIELVMQTDPVERLKTLQQAFEDAGTSVQDMSYYQKLAFVDMIPGISNVTELTELLEGNFDALGDTIGTTGKGMQDIRADALTRLSPDEMLKEALELALKAENLIPKVQALTVDSVGQTVEKMMEVSQSLSDFTNATLKSLDQSLSITKDENLLKRVRGTQGTDGINAEELARVMSEYFTENAAEMAKKAAVAATNARGDLGADAGPDDMIVRMFQEGIIDPLKTEIKDIFTTMVAEIVREIKLQFNFGSPI